MRVPVSTWSWENHTLGISEFNRFWPPETGNESRIRLSWEGGIKTVLLFKFSIWLPGYPRPLGLQWWEMVKTWGLVWIWPWAMHPRGPSDNAYLRRQLVKNTCVWTCVHWVGEYRTMCTAGKLSLAWALDRRLPWSKKLSIGAKYHFGWGCDLERGDYSDN